MSRVKKTKEPTTQLEVKTLLNRMQCFVGFVCQSSQLLGKGATERVEVKLRAHGQRRGKCATCNKPCPGYDTLPERRWLMVPLWNIAVYCFYAARRVACPEHGIGVEYLSWSEGKHPLTKDMMGFLAQWARRLSWSETARVFKTSWESVYRSVAWYVAWGLAHRKLEGVESIGVDEIHWGKGKKGADFLTVIYQIDKGARRLLWVGPKRTQAALRRGLDTLGKEVVQGIRFVCSDMWKPYLQVIAQRIDHALHVLDRFHITNHLNQAVDQVRRAESARLRGQPAADRLKKMRWKLLKRGSRVRGAARIKLNQLLASKLATARAWHLKEAFQHFWTYNAWHWAGGFLDCWTARAMRSRLEPMKKFARMLRRHEPLILNWFRAKKEISNGTTEGLNNKIRVVTRRSYGFRTYRAMEVALYHNLGKLPEPACAHRFC